MNEEQRKFFTVPFEKRESVFFQIFPDGRKLKERLLEVGGDRIAWRLENPAILIEEGKFFSLNDRKMVQGEVRRCHYNTARLFLESDVNIATGFALNKDVWIEHTWGCDGKRVIETTMFFDAYYGVILTGMEITKFVIGELGEEITKLPREQIMKLPMPKNLKEI